MSEPDLHDADVRAIVRLIGETAALRGTLHDKRRHFMTGLCRLVDADAWVWAQAAEMDPDRLPVYVGFIHGGFSEEAFARFLKVQTHPDMAWMTAPISRELQRTGRHVTRTLQQIVTPERFAASEVNKLWRECGFYPRIVSFYPLPDGISSGLGIYRRWDRPPCTEREARIVHVLTSEIAWLHLHESPETVLASVPRLPVRQRLTLEFLLQGQSRKAMAREMEISINTVSGYVRDIYRLFGVNSQAQLVSRFFRGDGGDAPGDAASPWGPL